MDKDTIEQLSREDDRQVLTFWHDRTALPEDYATNRKHNRVVDSEYAYMLCDEGDFEEVLDPKIEFRENLLDVYQRAIIPEVRSHLFRYAFLHRFGGWYVDCDVYQMRSLDKLAEIDNLVLMRAESQLLTSMVLKFQRQHPILLNMLKAIAANASRGLHVYNVDWFSGSKLFTAICSRKYIEPPRVLDFEEHVNNPGAIFATKAASRSEAWRIIQCFGVLEGSEPDFEVLPLRISFAEAGLLADRFRELEMQDQMKNLRAARPDFFDSPDVARILRV